MYLYCVHVFCRCPWQVSCVARLLYTPAALVWLSDTLSSRGPWPLPPPRNNLYFSALPNCISLLYQTVFLRSAKLCFSALPKCISLLYQTVFLLSAKPYISCLLKHISLLCSYQSIILSWELYFLPNCATFSRNLGNFVTKEILTNVFCCLRAKCRGTLTLNTA